MRFIDFVRNADLPILFNFSDIRVRPGNVSITVIEALATGLPTTVQMDDSVYEKILSEGAAVGFETGRVDILADRIETLLENPQLRAETTTWAESLISDSLS